MLTAFSQPKNTPAEEAALAAANAFFTAWFQNNTAALDSLLLPNFGYLPQGYLQVPKPMLLETARGNQRNQARGTLEWQYQDVVVQGPTAVFSGEARVESYTELNRKVSDEFQYTLTMTREPGGWRMLYLLRSPGGTALITQVWNKVFRDSAGFDLQPNRFLAQQVANLKPGTALDVAMGQGRNALLLARKGWQVIGVDVADQGLAIAQEQAKREQLRLTTEQADTRTYDFGQAKWDLVAMIYFGTLDDYLPRIHASLRPGGWLVFEGFAWQAAKSAPPAGQAAGKAAGPNMAALRQRLEQLGFTVQVFNDAVTQADYGMRHSRLIQIAAQKRN